MHRLIPDSTEAAWQDSWWSRVPKSSEDFMLARLRDRLQTTLMFMFQQYTVCGNEFKPLDAQPTVLIVADHVLQPWGNVDILFVSNCKTAIQELWKLHGQPLAITRDQSAMRQCSSIWCRENIRCHRRHCGLVLTVWQGQACLLWATQQVPILPEQRETSSIKTTYRFSHGLHSIQT